MSEKSMVGRKFVLWRTEYRADAYRDQFGRPHDGRVVLEQISVTVTEVRNDVLGVFGGDLHGGWKAVVSETGEVFTCNWNFFPDDAWTPTFYWDIREDARGLWQPEDACQAYNSSFVPYVTPEGKKAVPIGATICEVHDYAYMDGEGLRCFKCYLETRKAKK